MPGFHARPAIKDVLDFDLLPVTHTAPRTPAAVLFCYFAPSRGLDLPGVVLGCEVHFGDEAFLGP